MMNIGGVHSTTVLVIAVVIALAIVIIAVNNKLRKMREKVNESLSDIDVALTKRYDMLTKMVDAVKSHTKFEQETIVDTVRLRTGMSMDERNGAYTQIENLAEQVKLVCENYPQLGASESFRQLQIGIMDSEEHLQAARRAYNGNIYQLNQAIVVFPINIIAILCGIRKGEFFKAEDKKREDVSVSI